MMGDVLSGRRGSGLRIVAITLGALLALLVVVAVVRPEMMTMHAMRELFVGFGL